MKHLYKQRLHSKSNCPFQLTEQTLWRGVKNFQKELSNFISWLESTVSRRVRPERQQCSAVEPSAEVGKKLYQLTLLAVTALCRNGGGERGSNWLCHTNLPISADSLTLDGGMCTAKCTAIMTVIGADEWRKILPSRISAVHHQHLPPSRKVAE